MSIEALFSGLPHARWVDRLHTRVRSACPVCGSSNREAICASTGRNGGVVARCFVCDASGPEIAAAVGVALDELFPPKVEGVHTRPRERRPFNPVDLLAAMAEEATVVAVIACDITKRVGSTDGERQRLIEAARRLNQASELARGC
jgi:hypothetical protein